jgi:hypothetical protein
VKTTPFVPLRDLIIVEAMVGGLLGNADLQLVLDTGSMHTVIRPGILDDLGFNPRDGAVITGVYSAIGKEQGSMLKVPTTRMPRRSSERRVDEVAALHRSIELRRVEHADAFAPDLLGPVEAVLVLDETRLLFDDPADEVARATQIVFVAVLLEDIDHVGLDGDEDGVGEPIS